MLQQSSRAVGERRHSRTDRPGDKLTGPLDVVHALLNEERDGTLGGRQVLQRDAKVVALPGPPGGRVERFGGLGCFLESKERRQ